MQLFHEFAEKDKHLANLKRVDLDKVMTEGEKKELLMMMGGVVAKKFKSVKQINLEVDCIVFAEEL